MGAPKISFISVMSGFDRRADKVQEDAGLKDVPGLKDVTGLNAPGLKEANLRPERPMR